MKAYKIDIIHNIFSQKPWGQKWKNL